MSNLKHGNGDDQSVEWTEYKRDKDRIVKNIASSGRVRREQRETKKEQY